VTLADYLQLKIIFSRCVVTPHYKNYGSKKAKSSSKEKGSCSTKDSKENYQATSRS